MNYINLLNRFNEITRATEVSPRAQLLYFKMLDLWNKALRPATMQINNMRLCVETGTKSEKSIIAAREELVELGVITYEKGFKGKPGIYKIVDLDDKKVNTNTDNEDMENEIDCKIYSENDSKNEKKAVNFTGGSEIDCTIDCKKYSLSDSENKNTVRKAVNFTVNNKYTVGKTVKNTAYPTVKTTVSKIHCQKDCKKDCKIYSHNKSRVENNIIYNTLSNTKDSTNSKSENKIVVENRGVAVLSADQGEVLDFMSSNILVDCSQRARSKAMELTEIHGADKTISAIRLGIDKAKQVGAMNDVRILAYAEAVLRNWARDGYTPPQAPPSITARQGGNTSRAMDSLLAIINGED